VTQSPPATLKRLAILFLVPALACVSGTVWLAFQSRDALAIPIPLQSGFSTLQEFHVRSKAQYRIELRCSRTMPFEQLKHALQGGNLIAVTMSENGAPIQLRYLAEPRFRPGIVSTDEFGNLGFAQAWISQDVAVFAGDPQRLYKLSCSVVRPVAELTITSPTLIVALDPLEVEGGAVATFLLLIVAVLFGIVSLVLWVIHLSRLRRARRVQRAEA
jgi:hypothetical protein